jgi:hypothetical protein
MRGVVLCVSEDSIIAKLREGREGREGREAKL